MKIINVPSPQDPDCRALVGIISRSGSNYLDRTIEQVRLATKVRCIAADAHLLSTPTRQGCCCSCRPSASVAVAATTIATNATGDEPPPRILSFQSLRSTHPREALLPTAADVSDDARSFFIAPPLPARLQLPSQQ